MHVCRHSSLFLRPSSWLPSISALLPVSPQYMLILILIQPSLFFPKLSSLLFFFSCEHLICAHGFNHQGLIHVQINIPNPNSLLRHRLVYTIYLCISLFVSKTQSTACVKPKSYSTTLACSFPNSFVSEFLHQAVRP